MAHPPHAAFHPHHRIGGQRRTIAQRRHRRPGAGRKDLRLGNFSHNRHVPFAALNLRAGAFGQLERLFAPARRR